MRKGEKNKWYFPAIPYVAEIRRWRHLRRDMVRSGKIRLLVIGGSLGAQALNTVVPHVR